MNRAWAYQLVAETSDAEAAWSAAELGRDTALIRSPGGAIGGERELWPIDGQWHDSTRRLLDQSRGSYQWFFPVPVERAQELVNRWRQLGVLPVDVSLEARVDDQTEREFAAIDGHREAKGAMASTGIAPSSEVERIRAAVLDGTRHFAGSWLGGDGKVVVPCAFEDAPILMIDAHAARVADGFRAAGSRGAIGLALDPAAQRDRRGPRPQGFLVDLSAESMRAFGEQAITGGTLLADVDLRCAILDVTDYVLLAGSREFVEIVLDASLETAKARFRARADAAPDDSQLPAIADRYLPKGTH
jgi:hypothetical protein